MDSSRSGLFKKFDEKAKQSATRKCAGSQAIEGVLTRHIVIRKALKRLSLGTAGLHGAAGPSGRSPRLLVTMATADAACYEEFSGE